VIFSVFAPPRLGGGKKKKVNATNLPGRQTGKPNHQNSQVMFVLLLAFDVFFSNYNWNEYMAD
jgi:hypothetical protein